MTGVIDIVVNLFTEREVRLGQTGIDDDFMSQVRMPAAMRAGVSIEDYLGRMDRAGVGPEVPALNGLGAYYRQKASK